MDKFLKDFRKKNVTKSEEYFKYIKDNDWTEAKVDRNTEGNITYCKYYFIKDNKGQGWEGKEGEYKVQSKLISALLDRLTYFCSKVSEDIGRKSSVDNIIKKIRKPIDYHLKRIDDFTSRSSDLSVDEKDIPDEDEELDEKTFKSQEVEFDSLLYKEQNSIQDKIYKLDLDRENQEGILELWDNQKATLAIRDLIEREYPKVKEIMDSLNLDFTSPPKNEMLIHMENPPQWNPDKHYFEQDRDALQFYIDEYKKIKDGIKIDGVFISPWMYCHLNVFKTDIPVVKTNPNTGEKESKDELMHPPLRDNEWFIIQDEYEKAKRREDGYILFLSATRRAAKTTNIASHLQHTALRGGKELIVAGGSSKDLGQIEKNFQKTMTNADPAFKMLNPTSDWTKKVIFGIKNKNQRTLSSCVLEIINLDAAKKKKSEVLAGFTPDAFVLDECMKIPFLEQLNAAKPSFDAPGGKRCVPLLSGCVCAGTKVWNNDGNLVNIEYLKPEQGILGYDLENKEISQEPITYWQPPHKKPCYRIETNKGRFLECSEDHPILFRSRNETKQIKGVRKRKIYFKEAKDLKKGEHILVAESIPFSGNKKMWSPRLVGLLIGDGSYGYSKTPVLSNCDSEVNDYIYKNFNCKLERTYLTKDGKDYKETRIKEIRPELKELGIVGQSKGKKTLPKAIHSYREEDICEMLGGFFDADGHVVADGKNYNINLSSGYKNLLLEVLLLLQKLGIHCNINFKKPRKENPLDKNGYYVLNISDRKSVLEFHKKIKFMISYKQDKLEECVKYLKPRKNRIPKEFKNERLEIVKSVEYIGIKPVYNLTAGNNHTYLANGIITHNTGNANEELVEDALKVLAKPNVYGISQMNFDNLERGIPKELITWTRRNFGTFLPGQMSAKEGLEKIVKTLPEYLGIESTPKLNKIKIQVTDWKKSLDIIQKDRELKSGDKDELIKEKVYFPLDIEEIFLSGKENPFPKEEIANYRARIIEEGDIGKKVVFSYNKEGDVVYDLSNKEYADFPFGGGNHDAPCTIFEDPMEGNTFGFFVSSLDDYKQDKSDSDSVGSFVVINRFTGNIAATYHSRPESHPYFYEQGLMMIEYFKAPLFMENADMGFKTYTDQLDVTDEYLVESFDLTGKFEINGNSNRKFGWAPTAKNISSLMGYFINTMKKKEIYEDDQGRKRTKWGFEKVKDIRLLDEMVKFKFGGNHDGITAAMSAYFYDYYLQITYGAPQTPLTEEEKRIKQEKLRVNRLKRQKRQKNPFPNTSRAGRYW